MAGGGRRSRAASICSARSQKEVDDLSSKAQELEQENVALKDDVEQATQREARLLLQHQELHTQVCASGGLVQSALWWGSVRACC